MTSSALLRSAGALLCLSLAAGFAPAFAQSTGLTDLAEEADLHFQLGIDAYQSRDYQEALEHLLLSNRLAPNHNVVYNIARCYEKLGDPEQAYRHYTDFMAIETDPSRRSRGAEALDRLEDSVALVRVESDPPGATVYVNRKNLGARGQTPRTFALESGQQKIILEMDGHLPVELDAAALRGQTAVVKGALEQRLGDVEFSGGPEGAEVRLEGSDAVLGTLPGTFSLPPGAQVLVVSAPGYDPETLVARVSLEEPTRVEVGLDRVTSEVLISASERGALIEIDGRSVGFTPALVEVPVGAHELRISLDGFRSFQGELDVADGENPTLEIPLLPIQDVTAASGVEESLLDAPATMVVLTARDIDARGYTDLAEVMSDLPGFDVVVSNGTTYLNAYQRGYRTPFTQRTLLMINGKVDNHLWSHMANISRQYPISNIERIEVLYGPASAVYGPNAFLGIINIVTKDAQTLESGQQQGSVTALGGSWQTYGVDADLRGRSGDLTYSAGARVFRSDEPDLSDEWGFVSSDDYASEDIWGPMLDYEHLGAYGDSTDDWGVIGEVGLRGLTVGTIRWDRKEGYGPYYASDRAQNNVSWNYSSRQTYAEYEGEVAPRLISRSLLLHRESRVWGAWIEGSPDGDYSYISYTHWNSVSDSWLLRENLEWQAADPLKVTAGLKFERKELTKAYDIPGYWEGAYDSTGSEPGAGIGYSTDETYSQPAYPSHEMPTDNLALTDDIGGFAQGILDVGPMRFNGGLRYDWNSVYGGNFNPRVSGVLKFLDDQAALKLLYGQAFQEPAPIQLWGGWSGRAANPDLAPEQAQNLEAVAIYQTPALLNHLSAYRATYQDVIKEEAENAGERTVVGVEYRVEASLQNPIPESDKIRAYANYTWTHSQSSVTYDHAAAAWQDEWSELGDIAPHKANAGFTVPVWRHFNAHLRGNWVGERTLYSRNPLRDQGITADPYLLLHGAVGANVGAFEAKLKVMNLLDAEYLHPGVESASAGDDFDGRSAGYQNSMLPQPGRSYVGTLEVEF